jgi:hypothetical protein
MPSGCRCEKCPEIPSTAKLKVRSFHHCPKRSPQFQYIIDGGTGIVTFEQGISQQLLMSCYNTIYQTTVKHRIERIDDFLLIKMPSSIHGVAAMALRDALTSSIRKLEGVGDPDELFTFESLCDGGSLFGSHHFSDS